MWCNLKVVLFLILISGPCILLAQESESQLPDSLRIQYEELSEDSSKVNFILDHVAKNFYVNPKLCLKLLQNAKEISNKNQNFKDYAIHHNQSICHYQMSQWDSVLWHAGKALELTDSLKHTRLYGMILSNMSNTMRSLSRDEEANAFRLRARQQYESINDTLGLAIIDNDLGLYYFDLGNYARSMDHFQKAYKGLELKNHQTGQSIVLNNLGMIVHQQKDYPSARSYYRRSYEVAKEINSQEQMSSTLNNIGSSFQDEGLLDSAMVYHQMSLSIKEAVNDYGMMASNYNNFRIIYFKKKEFTKAVSNHNKAVEYARLGQDLQTEADALIKLAAAEKELNRSTPAIQHVRSGLTLAEQVANLQLQSEAHQLLFELLKNKAPSQAIVHLEKASGMRDSLLNEEKVRELAIKEKEFEFEKEKIEKQQEIELLNTTNELQAFKLNRSRRTLLFLSLALLSLVIISYLIYSNRSKIQSLNNNLRAQKSLLEKALDEKELLLKEIHHRVKNNLQVISSLLKLQSRSVDDAATKKLLSEGQNRVMSMALIHQNLYQDGNLSGIDMPSYIRQLSNELIDNYNASEKPVRLELHVEDLKLDVDTVVPIGLIINELITNALKYAFKDVDDPLINVKLKQHDGLLLLELKDNGPGFDFEDRDNEKLGLRLIRSFANRLKAKLTFDTNSGTHVTLAISDFTILNA